jgi:SsrA-binding protein
MADKKNSVHIKNKRAYFDYQIEENFVCGIVLQGTEVKSIRDGNANISEAHCQVKDNEVKLLNSYIAEYKFGGAYNHQPVRERKLLLNKREIEKIHKKVKEKGMTIVPIKMFINERGFVKVEIGIGKGKKTYDKREDLKKKDQKRDMDRHNY